MHRTAKKKQQEKNLINYYIIQKFSQRKEGGKILIKINYRSGNATNIIMSLSNELQTWICNQISASQ